MEEQEPRMWEDIFAALAIDSQPGFIHYSFICENMQDTPSWHSRNWGLQEI